MLEQRPAAVAALAPSAPVAAVQAAAAARPGATTMAQPARRAPGSWGCPRQARRAARPTTARRPAGRSAPMARGRPRKPAPERRPNRNRAVWRPFRANPMTVRASKPPGWPACWRPTTAPAVARMGMGRAQASPRSEPAARRRQAGPTTGRWAQPAARLEPLPTWERQEQWARSARAAGAHPMSAQARPEREAEPRTEVAVAWERKREGRRPPRPETVRLERVNLAGANLGPTPARRISPAAGPNSAMAGLRPSGRSPVHGLRPVAEPRS